MFKIFSPLRTLPSTLPSNPVSKRPFCAVSASTRDLETIPSVLEVEVWTPYNLHTALLFTVRVLLWVAIVSNLGFDVHRRYQLATTVGAKLFEIDQAVETKSVQKNWGFQHQRIYFAIQWNKEYLDLFTEGERWQGKKGGGAKYQITLILYYTHYVDKIWKPTSSK